MGGLETVSGVYVHGMTVVLHEWSMSMCTLAAFPVT